MMMTWNQLEQAVVEDLAELVEGLYPNPNEVGHLLAVIGHEYGMPTMHAVVDDLVEGYDLNRAELMLYRNDWVKLYGRKAFNK